MEIISFLERKINPAIFQKIILLLSGKEGKDIDLAMILDLDEAHFSVEKLFFPEKQKELDFCIYSKNEFEKRVSFLDVLAVDQFLTYNSIFGEDYKRTIKIREPSSESLEYLKRRYLDIFNVSREYFSKINGNVYNTLHSLCFSSSYLCAYLEYLSGRKEPIKFNELVNNPINEPENLLSKVYKAKKRFENKKEEISAEKIREYLEKTERLINTSLN